MPVSYRTRGPEAGNDPKTRNGTRASVLLFRTRFRGGVREVGKGSRPVQPPPFYENCTARSSCPERSAEICYSHLAINSRYFISNTRSAARGMPRDDRSFFSRSRFVVERLSLTVFAPNHEEFLKKYRNLEVIIL